jgi:hypothetical protein
MDLLTALKILIRQWPVVLAGFLLTIVGVIQVGNMVDPTYEAKGTVVLLSPSASNPFLEFPGGLEVTADALVVRLQSPVGGEQMEAAGATAAFSLERTNGPIVDVTAEGATEEEATGTVDVVVNGMKAALAEYQTGAAPDQLITVEVLTEPTAKAKLGSRIRAQAATGAIGLAATVAAGLAVDAVRRQLREARLRREAEAEAEEWAASAPGGPPGAGFRPAPDGRGAHVANGRHNGAPQVTVVNGSATGAVRNGRASVYPARATTPRPQAQAATPGAPAIPAPSKPTVNGRPAGEATRPPGDARPADEGRPGADEPAPDTPRASWP